MVAPRMKLQQQHNQTHCICYQKPDWSRKKIQQHRKRSPRHTIWTQEVPPILLMRNVSINTDYRPLAGKLKKDVVTLSQRLQWILLRIHQYRVKIIYKPGPELFVADWLSRQNHNKNTDAEIPHMQLGINAIHTATNIPECMTMHELQLVTYLDQHLQCLKDYIIQGWPKSRDQIPQDIRMYLTLRNDMVVIDGVIIKGKSIAVPEPLQKHTPNSYISIIWALKNWTISVQLLLLDRFEYWYWKPHKNFSLCLDIQQTQPKEKRIHEISGKPWEVIDSDMFTLNNNKLLRKV